MLAPGNYVQWESIIKRYIDTKPNNELIHYCLQNPPYKFKWTEKTVPVAEGSSETTTEGAKDAAYRKENMLLCKQEEAGFLLNAEQADWRDDTNDEPEDQELEAQYMYMAQIQEVTPDAADNSGPIFDAEPLQKVQNNDDNYNVFAIENEHPEQPESVNDTYLEEQGDTNITIDSLDMCNNGETVDQDDDDLAKERDLLASLIEKLKCKIDDSKNRNKFLETSNKALVDKLKGEIEDFKTKNKSLESSNNHFKEVNNDLSKTNQLMFKGLKKFQAKLDRYHDVNYASKVEIDCVNKAKGCYNDNVALMLAPEFDETIHLAKESRSKLIDLITPFDYDQLNNLYDLEYYYADHMNAILGVYTELDEVTNLQCDYMEALEKCERLEKELSKSRTISKSFEALQKHAINLELALPQYSLAKTDFSKSKSVTTNNVSNDFSKPVTAQILPQNVMTILKNTNVIAPGMYKVHTKPNQTRTPQLPQDIRKTNKRVSFSTGVIPTTSVSRPQLKSNQLEDRVMPNNSQGKKQEVEDHRRNFKFSNNKTFVTACNDSLNAKTSNVNFVCVTCGKCVLNDNHDMCVLHYINGVNSRTKMPMVVPISTREHKRTVNQSVATPLKRTVASESTNQKPRHTTRKLYEHVSKTCSWWYPKFTPSGYKWKPKSPIGNVNTNLVEIILFIVDSGCSKHMTGNLKLLSNFVEKFLGTVKFGNDQIALILGYGDLVQGNITIKRVYYVEGLNHNLFSVGQFCDADLEVAFRKSTCYIRDLKGNDLLTGSRGTDLYSITLQDTSTPNPICLMAKASSSQAWLWHRRLSHLNFDTINLLLKYDIVTGLPKLKFVKDHLCSSCELGKAKRNSFHTKTTPSSKRRLQLLHMDLCGPMQVESINGKKYVLVIVDDYSRYTWTHFLRSKDETPEVFIDFLRLVQRGLHADKGTKLLNKTLHAYFDQEAIATACFTQNRSLIIPRHEKTPYHIINGRKLFVKFFHIFGSLCYIVRDGENLDKMKVKGDACIFLGYSTQSRAYRVYNKRTRVIVETIHVNFDEFPQMVSDHGSSDPVPQCPTTALEHDSLSPDPQSQENVHQAAETVTTSNELNLLFSLMFDELLN
ncbi:retrovirus-related pol polyprotein from transposon TNT 1-94 [Tanacetum coccineum]